MRRIWENTRIIIGAIFYGVVLAFGLPPRLRLRFEQMQEMNTINRKILLIKLQYRAGKRWNDCRIGINPKNKRIAWSTTDNWLFGEMSNSDGALGAIVIASPIILLLTPILKLVHKHYEKKERRLGLSRHSQSILKALKGQLEPSVEKLLATAMKNEWKHGCEMLRELTIDEALEFLRQHDLKESCAPERTSPYPKAEFHSFHWFNADGDVVAEGSFDKYNHYIHVLGSWFEEEKADELVKCYKTKAYHEFKK